MTSTINSGEGSIGSWNKRNYVGNLKSLTLLDMWSLDRIHKVLEITAVSLAPSGGHTSMLQLQLKNFARGTPLIATGDPALLAILLSQ